MSSTGSTSRVGAFSHDDDIGYWADKAAFDALVEVSGKDNRVVAITSGHHHGENWCGRSDASDGLSIWYAPLLLRGRNS